ncbi:MAG: cob(I)yrinic acid a,c-diamide adenosyltransferase [Candidatus Woesearchaeota archaeon]
MVKWSISTKFGDKGNTSVMFGRKVPKHNLRVDAYGSVDELNAALGLIRAAVTDNDLKEEILRIQKDMFQINKELATTLYDNISYDKKDNKDLIGESHIDFIQDRINEIQEKYDLNMGWSIPGENWNSALFELARTICRRAERTVVALDNNKLLENRDILIYLNRLSDMLWLLARKEEISGKK